jgi:hypothetical protein
MERGIMADHTPAIHMRVPSALWAAYGRVCARKGRDRTEDLLVYMRRQIEILGDEQDHDGLAEADAELAERRARRGGRPRKPATSDE